MPPPKRSPIPLQLALVRFVEVADLIEARAAEDEALAELWQEHDEAVQVLEKLKFDSPRATFRIAEYETLVAGLKEELIQCLLTGKAGR